MKQTKTFLYNRIGVVEDILKNYEEVTMTVEAMAKKYNVTPRTIQRLVKKHGIVRTISESNKVIAYLKNYSNLRKPEHLKARRKYISAKRRYEMISNHPYCATCGNKPAQCPLNIDHIDNNATNNKPENLQVLCMICNQGKR